MSHEKKKNDDLPFGFKSWNQLYALVLGNLLFLIILFYFFTKAFV